MFGFRLTWAISYRLVCLCLLLQRQLSLLSAIYTPHRSLQHHVVMVTTAINIIIEHYHRHHDHCKEGWINSAQYYRLAVHYHSRCDRRAGFRPTRLSPVWYLWGLHVNFTSQAYRSSVNFRGKICRPENMCKKINKIYTQILHDICRKFFFDFLRGANIPLPPSPTIMFQISK